MTEDCNYNCSYCYQKKRKKYIETSAIEKALDFFLPFLKEECYINFHGGEPLLAYDKIKRTVSSIQDRNGRLKKQIHFSIVTNGSLIDDVVLEFLNQHKFYILLSFDGLTQDISRKKGSFKKIVEIVEKLLRCPDIELDVCSVSTPETVGYLSSSLQFSIGLGVPNIYLSLSTLLPWDPGSLLKLKKELASLKEFLLAFYRRTRAVPLISFRKSSGKGVFFCNAGRDRLALSPEEKLWGCYLFPDYFKGKEGTPEYEQYCFGELDSFIKNHERVYPEIRGNYSKLRMDYFSTSETSCRDCDELRECEVCPMDTALSGFSIGKIPGWTCEIKKIIRKEKEIFWRELEN